MPYEIQESGAPERTFSFSKHFISKLFSFHFATMALRIANYKMNAVTWSQNTGLLTKRYLPEKEAGESGFAGAGGTDYRYNCVRRNLQI